MDELLLALLVMLEEIGRSHEEIYDSDCRDAMGDAIFHGFINPVPGYELPKDFGLDTDDANRQVRDALRRYLESANQLASKSRLTGFHARLAAFQNRLVRTSRERRYFDDFFGWSDPRCFDRSGKVVDPDVSKQVDAGDAKLSHGTPLQTAPSSTKLATTSRALTRHAAIYVCLALFFAFCWFTHHAAFLNMETCQRQFTVMTDKTRRAMALIDWIDTHSWLAIAYVVLIVASVAFLQVRRRPAWSYWLTAIVFCIPGGCYWCTCVYILKKH